MHCCCYSLLIIPESQASSQSTVWWSTPKIAFWFLHRMLNGEIHFLDCWTPMVETCESPASFCNLKHVKALFQPYFCWVFMTFSTGARFRRAGMLSESVHQQGMAGSGKSTLMHRMVVRLGSSSSKVYTVTWSSTLEDLHWRIMVIICG